MKKTISFEPSSFLEPMRVKPKDLFPEEVPFYIEQILSIGTKADNPFRNKRESHNREKAEQSIIKDISDEVRVWHTDDLFLLFEYFKRIDEFRRLNNDRAKEKLANTFLSVLLRKTPPTLTEERIYQSERISLRHEEDILSAVFPRHNSTHIQVMYTELLNYMIKKDWGSIKFGNQKELSRFNREYHDLMNDVFNALIGRYYVEDHEAHFPKNFSVRDKKSGHNETIWFRRYNPFTEKVYFKVDKWMNFDPRDLEWKIGGGNGYNHSFTIERHYSCYLGDWDSLVKSNRVR